MAREKLEFISRSAIALFILGAGIILLPVSGLAREQLSWRLFAGIYTPDLTITPVSGAPGSAFIVAGSNYPSNSTAAIFINGTQIGTIPIEANGAVDFLVQTYGSDALGRYDVTVAVDNNAVATQGFDLVMGEPIIPPPQGYSGLRFDLNGPIARFNSYLPFVTNP